jgi:two-component system, LytTR family, sensor histidine kinase AlgZ
MAAADRFFLPDFCTARSVVAVLVVAQFTAFVLTLARPGGAEPWMDLVRLSLFLHWIALLSAAALCVARPWLARIGGARGVAASFALLAAVAVLVAEASWWTAQWSGIGSTLVPATRAEFVLRTLGLSLIVSAAVLRYLWVQHQWRLRVEAEAGTRFTALQARIRPHFLFNSMNTIAALTRSDPARAEQATEDLADLFRASLAEGRQRVTLADELDLCRRYARIEAMRLGDRLRIDWKTDALPPRARIPGLILQPLVENAIYHGVETAERGATVAVTGRVDGDTAVVEVRNPLPPDRTGPRQGLRIALDNVAERVALAFPGRGRLDAEQDGDEFVVTVRFPVEDGDAPPGR